MCFVPFQRKGEAAVVFLIIWLAAIGIILIVAVSVVAVQITRAVRRRANERRKQVRQQEAKVFLNTFYQNYGTPVYPIWLPKPEVMQAWAESLILYTPEQAVAQAHALLPDRVRKDLSL